jgi:replication factor C small subunit
MEKYTNTVRFILNANYSSKLIGPIQSRCSLFKFKPLKTEEVDSRIRYIVSQENVSINEDAITAINEVCEGDMRVAVNLLQAAASSVDNITKEDIYMVSNSAQPQDIENLIDSCLDQNYPQARDALFVLLFDHGLSGEDIISQIYKKIMNYPDDKISLRNKITIIDKIAEINYRLVEGANDRIQLEALLAQLILMNIKE